MGKIINMNGEQVEVVPLDEARTFFRGRKGNVMSRRSFQQKIYREKKQGIIPPNAFTKTTAGNWWFDKKYLVGFTSHSNTAA